MAAEAAPLIVVATAPRKPLLAPHSSLRLSVLAAPAQACLVTLAMALSPWQCSEALVRPCLRPGGHVMVHTEQVKEGIRQRTLVPNE